MGRSLERLRHPARGGAGHARVDACSDTHSRLRRPGGGATGTEGAACTMQQPDPVFECMYPG